jgi:hypothetical protein
MNLVPTSEKTPLHIHCKYKSFNTTKIVYYDTLKFEIHLNDMQHSVPISQTTHFLFIIKASQLITFRKHSPFIQRIMRKKTELLGVIEVGTYSNLCVSVN